MKMSEKSRPKFITFEGGEGAGKTSLIDSIQGLLGKMNISVVRTCEPGGSVLGYQIRKWLLDKTDATVGNKAELLLFLAARAQHIEEVISPNIMGGIVVLCDRFNDSTVAYQGAARGLGIKWVQNLCDLICGDVLPDLTFYLDVDPQTGLNRTKKASKKNASAGKLDRIEGEKLLFHECVREAFVAIGNANPDRVVFINANRSKEVVFDAVKKIIQERFNI